MRLETLVSKATALMLAAAGAARAQTGGVSVRGVAYDSVRGRPLAGAFVALSGSESTATTDSLGRFQFASVAPGPHTFTVQHATLDSIGFFGISSKVTLAGASADVVIASPSFATIWRAVCGPGKAAADSAIVYGTVTDAVRHAPVAGATVDLTWMELKADKQTGVAQRRWRNQTRADSRGGYAACGVPLDVGLRVQALTDSSASGEVDLMPADLRVQRRDLLVGPARNGGATLRGTIAGMVTQPDGRPAAGTRVLMAEAAEVRSGRDGRFVIPNVPAGTRQLELLAIGYSPLVTTVDIVGGDTASVLVALRPMTTTLAAVTVTASALRRKFDREFAERRKTGYGYAMDSTQIARKGTMMATLAEFPSTDVKPVGRLRAFVITFPAGIRRCNAVIWVDGVRSDIERLSEMVPDDIAVIEVYPHRMMVPAELMVHGNDCGVVAVWTKLALR